MDKNGKVGTPKDFEVESFNKTLSGVNGKITKGEYDKYKSMHNNSKPMSKNNFSNSLIGHLDSNGNLVKNVDYEEKLINTLF